MSQRAAYLEKGWLRFPFDRSMKGWASAAKDDVAPAMADPAFSHWHRHKSTWFVGVDALPNADDGSIAGHPLSGPAINFIQDELGFDGPWHKAQISVCKPGYPQQDEGESDAQHAFRRNRDAAHLDGLKATGADKSRHLDEFHRFILGIPMNQTDEGAAPFVVWEGSHEIMRAMLQRAFKDLPTSQWTAVDLTETYQECRRKVFETCPRVIVHAKPGEAYLCHRFAIHGVAPWADGASAEHHMRAIAYLRPAQEISPAWLTAP